MDAVLYGRAADGITLEMPQQLVLLDDDAGPCTPSRAPGLSVRVSTRAKRMILQMIPPGTLELVVPRGVGPKAVQAFVREHSEWIRAAERELTRHGPAAPDWPSRIELPALGRCWRIEYRQAARTASRACELGDRLELRLAGQGELERARLLRNWLLDVGRRHLKPWLAAEAARVGEPYSRVQVRLQRTRWGSCSSGRNISLNAALLFVDPALVRYLLVHELCHLRYLNHSKPYWRLVERFEPDYRRLDARLAEAWAEIPFWALVKAR